MDVFRRRIPTETYRIPATVDCYFCQFNDSPNEVEVDDDLPPRRQMSSPAPYLSSPSIANSPGDAAALSRPRVSI
jgi:hypothetical protein